MAELFSAEPIRPSARRGERSVPMHGAPRTEPWPPRDRDDADVAVVATRILATSGRLASRLHATARQHAVDPYVLRLLLLFAESDHPLRIGNIADLLAVSHSTASRTATRAHAAGLVDKFSSVVDRREVDIRLTHFGRTAVTRCLDALRADVAEILGLGRSATVHPRGGDLKTLLGPGPRHRYSSDITGWRAGVRAGMPDD